MAYEEILERATDIAERASEIALSYFRQAILIEIKDNGTPVTVADKKTEEAIRNDLARAFPGHGIWGEEFGEEASDAEFVWTVDPIDGTRSFIRGIPLFGTLLGLLHRNQPVLGIMVLPALNETYTAAKGRGAFCGDVQLHVSGTADVAQAVIGCGDAKCFEKEGKLPQMQRLMKNADIVRGYTDCFGHSLVLRGALDAMVDPIVSIWDVAPLACLVEEAGGCYYQFDGDVSIEGPSFISSSKPLKGELVRAMA